MIFGLEYDASCDFLRGWLTITYLIPTDTVYVEVRGRTPITGEVMPSLWLKLLGIMTIILAIFVSPVVSMQWAVGQQGNETDVGEAFGGAGNDAEQTSVVGDGANVDTNGGTVQASPIDDGSNEDEADTGSSASQKETSIEDEADRQSNQELSSVVEDGIAIDDSDDGIDGYSVKREDAAAIREWATQKKLALKEFDGSNLANSTQILSSLRDKSIENSKSTNNEDATTHSPTESTSEDRFSNSSLSRQYNDGIIKLESAHIQSQEITNQTISTLHQQSSFPTEAPVLSNQSAVRNVPLTSSQNITQVSSSETEQSVIEPVVGAVLINDTLIVTPNETSTPVPVPSNESYSFPPVSTTINGTEKLSTVSIENPSNQMVTLFDSPMSELQTKPPNSIVQMLSVGNDNVISFGDIKNTNNASATLSWDKELYFLHDTAEITVNDFEANIEQNATNTIRIVVTSTSDPAGIPVELIETGLDTGVFQGLMNFTTGKSSGNSLQISGTDVLNVYYDTTHPRMTATISGVNHTGSVQLKQLLVSSFGTTLGEFQPDLLIGNAIELTLVDGAQLASNTICIDNFLPSPCGGNTTVTLSYANAPLNNQHPLSFTIWQFVSGVGWVDLRVLPEVGWPGSIIVDENAKTVTVSSPLGPGVFVIGVNIGSGGGGGGGAGFPGAGHLITAVAHDPLTPVLNPLLVRPIVSVQSNVEVQGSSAQEDDTRDENQINVLPTALAATDNCDTNDAILANYSSINCPTANKTIDESVPPISKLETINASTILQAHNISVDADVNNLIIEMNADGKDVVIVEGTNLFWVNSQGAIQAIQALEKSTGQKVLSNLSVPGGSYTSYKFVKPGIYEYSNPVNSNISNSGTVQVLSKGESVDNISTNSTTPTLGVIKVPIKRTENFLSGLNATGSLVLSSYRIPSSSDILYVWSNESAKPTSILAALRQ